MNEDHIDITRYIREDDYDMIKQIYDKYINDIFNRCMIKYTMMTKLFKLIRPNKEIKYTLMV